MVALNVARNFRSYTSGVLSTLVTLAVIGAGLLAVGVIIAGVMWAVIFYQDQAMMRNCMTAYERQARAAAAPDDYFGKRLREQAADEAKKCAELATKKEAEANESKPTPRGSR